MTWEAQENAGLQIDPGQEGKWEPLSHFWILCHGSVSHQIIQFLCFSCRVSYYGGYFHWSLNYVASGQRPVPVDMTDFFPGVKPIPPD